MITLKVPGKLFIIGEYSVIKPGNEAVLVGVDKFIHVKIKESDDYEFRSELGRFRWMLSDQVPVFMYDTLTHAKAAIYIAHKYLKYKGIEPKTYELELSSELTSPHNIKYGLGSSGAVIIACIRAVLELHQVKIKKIDLFKLAVLAQIEISDVTSGGELAASIYGGWVYYQRYDLVWVMNRKGKLDEIMTLTWPFLKIEQLNKPLIKLAICFSGMSQSTKAYTDSLSKVSATPWYATFLSKTKLIVNQFKEALVRSDYYTMKYMMELYREMLKELENKTGIIIESEPFKKMIEISQNLGFSAKTSGAGYGDCGIAIVRNETDKRILQDAWIKAGLTALDLKVWE